MVPTSLGMGNPTFSLTLKWRWASHLETNVKMAHMDYCDTTLPHHPIIPIPFTFPQPTFSPSIGMLGHSTPCLLDKP